MISKCSSCKGSLYIHLAGKSYYNNTLNTYSDDEEWNKSLNIFYDLMVLNTIIFNISLNK